MANSFRSALYHHLRYVLTSSGVAVGLFFVQNIFRWNLPRWVYVVIVGLGVLWAASAAWRDQHDEVVRQHDEVVRLRGLLDDRERQQRAADEYSPLVDRGRKIIVRWAAAARMTDGKAMGVERDASMEWLKDIRSRLERDFGPAVASRFNLGKPEGITLGMSEPSEHEARVVELERLIREMRDGSLHLRARP
jgi:hypothetical protein